jgi:hypothetical protein
MHYAVAIPLKFIAIGVGKLGITTSARGHNRKFKMGEVPGHEGC